MSGKHKLILDSMYLLDIGQRIKRKRREGPHNIILFVRVLIRFAGGSGRIPSLMNTLAPGLSAGRRALRMATESASFQS
jgi:hypothetical protein